MLLALAPGVLALVLALGSSAAHALPTDPCGPCDGLTEVGPNWRVRVVAGRETLEGKGDHAASVAVYRVSGGQCCLTRTKADYPGVYLLGADPAHARIFLVGHDAQWAALATNGIWSFDLATGQTELVVAHIWNDVPCEATPLRFAAILQSSPKPSPAHPHPTDASAPSPDPYAGTFRLVAFDLAAPDGPTSFPVATRQSLRDFDASFDGDLFAKAFHWSHDCSQLTYALSPRGAAQTFRMPAARAK